MDWYPLFNSLRIALISTFFTFFLGIFAAWYVHKLPRALKGLLDCVLTLPLVLPPTVVGFFLLKLLQAPSFKCRLLLIGYGGIILLKAGYNKH